MAETSFLDDETPLAAPGNIWKVVLGAKGLFMSAKAKIMGNANKSVTAISNCALTPVDHSTAARAGKA